MVTDEDAELVPGFSADGEKLQLKLRGSPAQKSEIAWLRVPDCAVAVTVNFPVSPAAIVMAVGVAAKETLEPPELLPPQDGA